MNKYLLTVVLLSLLTSCSKIGILLNHFTSEKVITSFSVISAQDTIKMNISDSTIECSGLDKANTNAMVAVFSFKGKKVRINGVVQVSGQTVNDFSKVQIYVVEAEDGSIRSYAVKARTYTGMPFVYLTSPPILSKEIYVQGKFDIDGNVDYANSSYKMQIRGRGNSTWHPESIWKLPFKVKFDDKQQPFGMPADKEWALLANWFDKSLMRTDVAFELSERLQREWTPRRKFVDVYMNGIFHGNYLMTETIKEGSDRVKINLKKGGWLAEITHSGADDPFWFGAGDIPADFKEGSLPKAEVKTQLDSLYAMLYRNDFDGYKKIFDLDSYVSWFIVNELTWNSDAFFWNSVYLQKDSANGKIKMGPTWDYDLSLGNAPLSEARGWRLDQAEIANHIWLDPDFHAALKMQWNHFHDEIFGIMKYISQRKAYLKLSGEQNFVRWTILNDQLGPNQAFPGTWSGEVDYMTDFLKTRMEWMNNEINK